jgi:hypothetical protein
MTAVLLLAGNIAHAAASSSDIEPLVLSWASSPVFANETLLLHGSGFLAHYGPALRVRVQPLLLQQQGSGSDGGAGAGHDTASPSGMLLQPALAPSAVSLMVVLPASLQQDSAYAVQVQSGHGATSNVITVNTPDVWWLQGDGGNISTPGGWVRVFGRALSLVPASNGRRRRQIVAPHAAASDRAIEDQIRQAIAAGNMALLERLHASQRAVAARVAASLRQQSSTGSRIHYTTLHLRHVDGRAAPVTLTALNLTAWSALFAVPHTLAPGRYNVSVSNGHGPPVPVDCFVSPSLPSVRWVDVAAQDPAWPPSNHFNVTAFGNTEPVVGRDPPGGVTDGSSRPPLPFVMPVNSTPPLLAALAAAKEAGGGTVMLPEGALAIEPGLAIPDGVILRGARTDLTAVHFLYDRAPPGPDQNLPFAHIHRASLERPGRWGLSDLTLYQLWVYRALIYVARTDYAFTMERVRIRANAYAFNAQSGGPAPGPGINAAVLIHGTNFRLVDNDILATWAGVATGAVGVLGNNQDLGHFGLKFNGSAPAFGYRLPCNNLHPEDYEGPGTPPMPAQVRDCMQHNWGGASFGLIANNKVKSGGAQFWLGQGSQLIVEDNEFTGWGHVSGGNAIQTYRGGYSQHLFMGRNVVSDVWGADPAVSPPRRMHTMLRAHEHVVRAQVLTAKP